eukprot:gene1575-1915_t
MEAEFGPGATLESHSWLPQDLPMRFAEQFIVQEDDPVEMLRGQLAVRATDSVPGGTVLGPYRGYMMFDEEYKDLRLRRRPSSFGCGDLLLDNYLWELLIESYAVQDGHLSAQLRPEPSQKLPKAAEEAEAAGSGRAGKRDKAQGAGAGGKRRQQQQQKQRRPNQRSEDGSEVEELEQMQLFCSAFGYGNQTCLANDPSLNPLDKDVQVC